MYISHFRFIGNFRLSLVSSLRIFSEFLPLVFPRKSDMRLESITLRASSFLPNCWYVGFSLFPPRRLCLPKCSSSGSCENFSLRTKKTPSSFSSNFVSSVKDLTKKIYSQIYFFKVLKSFKLCQKLKHHYVIAVNCTLLLP